MVVLYEATIYYLCMSTIKETIKQNIRTNIFENPERRITGQVMQDVLLNMVDGIVDRDVFLSEDEYDALVESGQVDPDKIYHVYEE